MLTCQDHYMMSITLFTDHTLILFSLLQWGVFARVGHWVVEMELINIISRHSYIAFLSIEVVSKGSWFWWPHGPVSSIYIIYALCYVYEQVVLYCDCYVETCFLSFFPCFSDLLLPVLLCIAYLLWCYMPLYELCRLFPIPFFWLLYYSVGSVVYHYGQPWPFLDCKFFQL
jgi:hypothetical protein